MARTHVAVFASEQADLFESLTLPRSVPNQVAIGRSPLVGPLARLERRERWCVALVNRRDARIFRGSPESLQGDRADPRRGLRPARPGRLVPVPLSARHREGEGRPPEAHGRGADAPLQAPAVRASDRGRARARWWPTSSRSSTHYLQERLAGRIEVDVEHSNADAVLEAARPADRRAGARPREVGARAPGRARRGGCRGRAPAAARAAGRDAAARRAVRRRSGRPVPRSAAGSGSRASAVPPMAPSSCSSTTSPRR